MGFPRGTLHFGQLPSDKDLTILEEEVDYVVAREATKQFLSPLDYQQRIFGRDGRKPPNKAMPLYPGTPRARFAYHLRLTLLGCYWWNAGTSKAFHDGLSAGAQGGIDSYSFMG